MREKSPREKIEKSIKELMRELESSATRITDSEDRAKRMRDQDAPEGILDTEKRKLLWLRERSYELKPELLAARSELLRSIEESTTEQEQQYLEYRKFVAERKLIWAKSKHHRYYAFLKKHQAELEAKKCPPSRQKALKQLIDRKINVLMPKVREELEQTETMYREVFSMEKAPPPSPDLLGNAQTNHQSDPALLPEQGKPFADFRIDPDYVAEVLSETIKIFDSYLAIETGKEEQRGPPVPLKSMFIKLPGISLEEGVTAVAQYHGSSSGGQTVFHTWESATGSPEQ